MIQDIVVYIVIGVAALFAISWVVRGAKRLNRGETCDESQCGGCSNSCKKDKNA